MSCDAVAGSHMNALIMYIIFFEVRVCKCTCCLVWSTEQLPLILVTNLVSCSKAWCSAAHELKLVPWTFLSWLVYMHGWVLRCDQPISRYSATYSESPFTCDTVPYLNSCFKNFFLFHIQCNVVVVITKCNYSPTCDTIIGCVRCILSTGYGGELEAHAIQVYLHDHQHLHSYNVTHLI